MSRVRAVLGTVLSFVWLLAASGCRQAPPPQPPPAAVSAEEIAALKAEVERLKGVAPSASVAMADVGFHIANLWFAGQAKN